jgi:hypothetical protein
MDTPIGRGKVRGLPTPRRRWRTVAVHPYAYIALVLLLFFGVIQGFQRAGVWTTSSRVTATGEKVVATGKDPAEIKGWMTLGEVLAAYGLPRAEFDARFGTPADLPATTALKDIEQVAPGFSTESVRAWLKARPRPALTAPVGD